MAMDLAARIFPPMLIIPVSAVWHMALLWLLWRIAVALERGS
jgi:hypothetical protein